MLFATIGLLTGPLWGRIAWGAWWTWEPRLTLALLLWFIYLGYFLVRKSTPNPEQGKRLAAVVGIIGFVDVPIVYYSVVWWRSIHPSPVVGPLSASDLLDRTMYAILLFSFITFLLFFSYLVLERMALRDAEDELAKVRFSLRRAGR